MILSCFGYVLSNDKNLPWLLKHLSVNLIRVRVTLVVSDKIQKAMKSLLYRRIALEVICLLYILLFVYAATSKLSDYHDFLIQIGKSPILTAFAELAAIGVITLEALIALLLFFPKYRFVGLFLSLSLMTMFSAYITILLLWSPYVPCSCGGILSVLGWTEHLIFNLFFVVLAIAGLLLIGSPHTPDTNAARPKYSRLRSLPFPIILNVTLSTLFIGILYLLSEEKVHRNNGFIRRYPHHPVTTLKGISVKYNSFYIAGFNEGNIYLGNLTAPSHVFSTDTTLTRTTEYTVKLMYADDIAFSAPKLHISSGNFYITDGNASVIFKGNLSNWTAGKVWQGREKFLQVKPVSKDTFIASGLYNNTMALGLISGTSQVQYFPALLAKTTEGLFENDGMLLYNPEKQKLLYTHYYKNNYLSFSKDLRHVAVGKTIDTLRLSTIKIGKEDNGTRHTIANHAEMVQVHAATSGHYLFIKSRRLGKYEEAEMLKEASIIDIYDLGDHSYVFSFYLYHYENEEIRSFEVYENLLVGLTDHYLVLYRLQPYYFKNK